jgi:hypothetical protein
MSAGPGHGPLRHDDGELLLEEAQALNGVFDRVDAFLKDHLLRCMLEILAGEPAPMRQRPMPASAANPSVPQQKGKQLLAFAVKVVRDRFAARTRSRTVSAPCPVPKLPLVRRPDAVTPA